MAHPLNGSHIASSAVVNTSTSTSVSELVYWCVNVMVSMTRLHSHDCTVRCILTRLISIY